MRKSWSEGACENMYAKNMRNVYDSDLHRRDANIHYSLEYNLQKHRYKLACSGAQDW